MKKRLLSLLLTLSLLLSLMPTAVFAADASTLTVVINDVHVVEDGRAVAAMPSGVRYSETTNTLTLDDADLGMLRIYGGSLTIALEGDSTVHNDGSYAYRGGDHAGEPVPAVNIGDVAERLTVTITGPGSLTADTSGSGARRTFLADDTDLTITDGARVTVRSSDAGGGVAEMVSSRLILNGGAGLTGKELFVSEDGTLLVDGASLEMDGDADYALHLREGGQATILDGTVSLFGTADTHVPLRCEADCVLALLGGTVLLEQESAGPLMKADGTASVLIGDGMTAVDNATGNTIPVDDAFRRQISGTSVTISGERSLGMYACELSIPSGQVTQGVRFNVRAVVTLGAETGEVSFTLPAGVSYVPGSLTVDSRSVDPAATSPLTVELTRYGVIRFSAVASRTGTQTLTASTAAGGQTHRESLDFAVADFDLSLPSRTTRLEIPVTGTAAPGSAIAFYEGDQLLGRAEANSLGTWAGTVVLPDVEGEHTVYAAVTPAAGSGFRSGEQIITYDPDADEVTTLTVTNYVHGRTSADPPVEETLVIDYLTGADSADYYTFWPDLPTFSFQVEFLKDASAQGSVTVVTTDRMGRETRVPLRYQAARDAWVGSADYTEDTAPYQFRVEFIPGRRESPGTSLEGEYTYDAAGNIIQAVYENSVTYTYAYDNQNRPVQAVQDSVTYFYNDAGLVERVVSQDGTEVTLHYDSAGYLSELLFDDKTFITYTRNQYGQLIAATDGQITCYYDENFQIDRIDGAGGTAALSYHSDGSLARITYPDGTYMAFTYTGDGRVSQVTDGAQTISLRYEGDSTVMTMADGTELAWSPSDTAGPADSAMLRIAPPDGSSVTYTATEQSITIAVTDTDGETLSCSYNPEGYLTEMSENGAITTLDYDGENRLSQITYPNGKSIAYQYDEQDRITLVTDSDGYQTGYLYADEDRLAAITDGATQLVTYTYNADGSLARQDNANGTYTLYTYDEESVTGIRNYAAGGALLSSFAYTYDAAGRIVSMEDGTGTWSYAYDSAGQLTRAQAPDGTVTTYAYDAAGNRTQVTRGGETTQYTANGENQYTAYGDITRTYDAAGNLLTETRDGRTARYTWDKHGRLIGCIDFDGTVYEYGYDAFGLRNQVTVDGVTTTYLNDPLGDGMPVASYGAGGEHHYVLSNALAALRTGGETYYYHSNLQGSVTEITGPGGTAVNRYTYDQEGGLLSRSEGLDNLFAYAGIYGLMSDGNGLVYVRARYLSAATGSFISKDPAGDRYDSNLYRYAGNDPVGKLDLTGEFAIGAVRATGAIVTKNIGQNAAKKGVAQTVVDNELSKAMAGSYWKGQEVTQTLGGRLNVLRGVLLPVVGLGGVAALLSGSPPAHAATIPDSDDPAGVPSEDPSPDTPFDDPEGGAPPWLRAMDNPVVEVYSWAIGTPVWWTVIPVYGGAYVAERWPDNPITKGAGWLGDQIGLLLYPDPDPDEWSDMILDPPDIDPGSLAEGVDPSRGCGPVGDPRLYPWRSQDPGQDPDVVSTPDRDKEIIWDPSGFVYEGIESNRLSGVTTTLYYSAGSAKPSGHASESQRWDAADFGQQNPLTTDALGQYLWMVPDGWWQVKYEKDGYETAWSDWLPVPPVQTEVNVGLVSRAAAELTLSGEPGEAAVLLRFDRPVQISTVTAETVRISRSGAALAGTLTPLDPGAAADGQLCATTFRLDGGQTLRAGDVLSASYSGVMTYAGTESAGSASAEPLTAAMPFTDVAAGAYYYDSVLWAVDHTPQITAGTSATTFSPSASCTRAQAVTFLWRAMGQPEPERTDNPFTDVPAGAYYYEAVLWAVENGITAGTTETTFSPYAPCTRAQIVTFLHRMEKEQAPATTDNPFRDVATGAYYYDAVLWAAEWGITSGTAADAFSPYAPCTRGQIVTFLCRDMA